MRSLAFRRARQRTPEIQALGLTLDTVEIRLHRARARLRARLGSGCDVYRDEANDLACEPKTGVSPGG